MEGPRHPAQASRSWQSPVAPRCVRDEDAHDLYRHKLGRGHPQTQTPAPALAGNLKAFGRSEQARRVLEDARANGS
jgi:hypothetical protein